MIALLEKDDACANGEIGLLDFDPIVWGQDDEIANGTNTLSAVLSAPCG